MATPSLLDWIMDLLRNDEAREAFNSNPHAALQSAGFSQVCGEDVADARTFVADTPGVQQGVLGEFLPEDTDDVADNIRYIINNYYYDNDRYILNSDEDLDEIDEIDDLDIDRDRDFDRDFDRDIDIDPDQNDQDIDQEDNDRVEDSIVRDSNLGTQDSFNPDNTIEDSFDPTATDSFNPDSSEGQTTVDQSGSLVGGDQVGRDNIEGNVIRNGIGDGNTVGEDAAGRDVDTQDAGLAALDHVVETGDVHVLSDLVNTDDIARDSLNDLDVLSEVQGDQNVVRDVHDLVNLLG